MISPHPLRALAQHIASRRWDSALIVLAMFVAVAALFATAQWAGGFVAMLVGSAPIESLAMNLAIGVGLIGIVTGASAVRDVLLVKTSAAFSSELRLRMLSSLVRQPASIGRLRSQGEALMRLASDIAVLHNALVRTLAIWVPSVVTALALIGGIVLTSPALAAATALLLAPMLAVIARAGTRLQGSVRLAQESVGELGAVISEALAGVREAKVFQREAALERRFADLSAGSVRQIVHEERLAVVQPAVVTFISFVGLCALVLAAAWWQRRGVIDAAGLTRFLVLLGLLVAPLQESIRSYSAVARVAALIERCREVLEMEVERDSDTARDLELRSGAVAYQSTIVEYPQTGFRLGPIDLSIGGGETVAIVGPSGSGKSTLLELIPRLGEPTSGVVTVDGADVRGLRFASLRSRCAFVPQEPYFFAGTIRENLLFARPVSDALSLTTVCRLAHVEEFVQRLPLGYEARLERGAANLSVGQRQRLALARAMLVDPAILLLDEPTAALDEESERLVIETLRTFTAGRTTLVVTHSARVLALAHRVVHLVNGRVVRVERGPRGDAAPITRDAFAARVG